MIYGGGVALDCPVIVLSRADAPPESYLICGHFIGAKAQREVRKCTVQCTKLYRSESPAHRVTRNVQVQHSSTFPPSPSFPF
ncbi:hypothetical protein EVAR_57814_1 [Eumeta japonica]|uniref:Uncharacterized protein n=1 Tax=Eumeta variegata TaxID=151549 RepID=A0A4C1ZAN2_EUMVA|nr:hypothetical protein EVAR_57814_1 [Eumeta japonica]